MKYFCVLVFVFIVYSDASISKEVEMQGYEFTVAQVERLKFAVMRARQLISDDIAAGADPCWAVGDTSNVIKVAPDKFTHISVVLPGSEGQKSEEKYEITHVYYDQNAALRSIGLKSLARPHSIARMVQACQASDKRCAQGFELLIVKNKTSYHLKFSSDWVFQGGMKTIDDAEFKHEGNDTIQVDESLLQGLDLALLNTGEES
ncbi:hypothetical protein C3B51_19460 [Pseudoalteromonas rubra]|uniref:Uncharacterized protein n=1 Tax=Pseudoalteromonas rubra TaxID=43658 RepID=A0A4Q7E427_9GAMM|nr:hypothetical protein [Pseudoalteromonas rubra]RZM74781.1 hypothetical protein C3B51_19460 [Pseudoalteromonas rubra]